MMNNASSSKKAMFVFRLLTGLLVLSLLVSTGAISVLAQDEGPLEKDTENFSSEKITQEDGTVVVEVKNGGPSSLPIGEGGQDSLGIGVDEVGYIVALSNVPAYTWVLGSAPTVGAMIAAFYDRNGFPQMYTGPENGGVAPLTSVPWGTWTDSEPWTYSSNPLVASQQGVDGRLIKGTIEDYWVKKGSTSPDPYITGAWPQHVWGDAVGDYMKTSQSLWYNDDGKTAFRFYADGARMFCSDMVNNGYISDGTLGLSQFYQARGYTVGTCFSQFTDNLDLKYGFTFEKYKEQIDNGHPVMIHLKGHTVIGIGYNPVNSHVVIHDTWDTSDRYMTWGEKYMDMEMLGVSIVNLVPMNDSISTPILVAGVPSDHYQSTTDATYSVGSEPSFNSCGQAIGYASVWYRFDPTVNGEVSVDTFGSNYDTMLGVWEGIPGTLTPIVCNNNARGTVQSQVSFNYTSGTTYFIGIAQHGTTQTGGTLRLHLTSFNDVPGNHPLWRFVEGFYDAGITSGCQINPLGYCPDRQVTRAEMAVFLLRSMNGTAYVPADVNPDTFSDVPVLGKEWMEPWIEQFYATGITTGCAVSPLKYCPERSVTRAEMAVFVLRAIHGPAYVPPNVTPNPFTDVPVAGKEWMEPWIEQFYVQGYTTGCAANKYCPERNVTRAEMAAFLSRAYSFPELPAPLP